MRTTWNGSISFGLVSIPVGLAPATKPAARASDISFRMLHRECGTPIKQKRFCPMHERDLGPDEIVKGWEVAKGQFVIVEEEEIEALTNQDDSRSIEIARFVDAAQVDPIFFDRTYFLVPAQAPAARRPYVLLLNAMRETGMAAMGRFVQQGREKLCLIRPKGDALALETLFVSADVYSQAEIEEAVDDTTVKKPELELAQQVIASLSGDFDPADLQSDYRRDLRTLLEAKLAGEEITAPEPVGRRTPVIDLMEALRRSVADAQEAKAGEEAGRWDKRRSAPSRSAAPRRARSAAAKRPFRDLGARRSLRVAEPVSAPGASRPAPAAAPGTASCRSCPGRSARLPRCTRESLPAGRCRAPSKAPRASGGSPSVCPPCSAAMKKPAGRAVCVYSCCAQAGSDIARSLSFAGINGPAPPKLPWSSEDTVRG